MSISVFVIRTFGCALMAFASLGVFAPASAAPLFYGTSLNDLGQELLIQADAAAGQIISTRGLMAVNVWPFETEIAFPPVTANGAVPEPSSLAMLAIGLGAIAAFRWRARCFPRKPSTASRRSHSP